MSETKSVLNESEIRLLGYAWQCIKDGPPNVDYDRLMKLAGHSNPRSTQNAIRAINKKLQTANDTASAPGSEPATPTTPATPSTPKPKTSGGKGTKRKAVAAATASADEDDEEEEKPKPVRKGAGKKAKTGPAAGAGAGGGSRSQSREDSAAAPSPGFTPLNKKKGKGGKAGMAAVKEEDSVEDGEIV